MYQVIVGMGTCGISGGAKVVFEKLSELKAKETQTFTLSSAGCIGMCYREPLVEVRQGSKRIIYGNVTPKIAEEIYEKHLKNGQLLAEHVILQLDSENKISGPELDYQKRQMRIVLRNCGYIDPEKIDEYLTQKGYQALKKVLSLSPEVIIKEIKESGLRGRGGGRFSYRFKMGVCFQIQI